MLNILAGIALIFVLAFTLMAWSDVIIKHLEDKKDDNQ